jgi:hypothetical protein
MGGRGAGPVHEKRKNCMFFSTQNKNTNGHQFKGRVVRIVRIEAINAAQSIVDILGRPIWWCEDGHGVVVIELMMCARCVCIKILSEGKKKRVQVRNKP